MTPISPLPMTNLERWRAVACDFHSVRWCLERGTLRPDFEPIDLDRLSKQPASRAVKGVFSFLLHCWNSANRFDLAEIRRWDREHINAFVDWVNGRSTGQPCHYF